MTDPRRALFEHLVDYAGLFPPAALSMERAVAHYASYRNGAHAWMLGRFVVPVARMREFADAADPLLRAATDPWRVSAVIGADIEGDVATIAAFNSAHRRAVCDTIELKAASRDDISAAARAVRAAGVATFVEIPLAHDPAPLIDEIAARGLCAKMRTGGTTPDAFPAARDVVRFISACIRAGVPFKATAGLHHPLRGEYRLTYAPDSACGTMFGFLNVFLASALVRDGGTEDDAIALLTETNPAALTFADDGAHWRGHVFLAPRIAQLRARVATSFGSCSFDEPVADLTALQLL